MSYRRIFGLREFALCLVILANAPKPEFLPLFNLGEPITTGDAELVTGGMEQS